MATQRVDGVQDHRIRFRIYRIWSVVATILFLFFMTTMLMVPGVLPSAKLWMLTIAGISVAVPLVIGVWKFSSTDAPVMEWPLGPLLGVILLGELAECVISVVLLLRNPHLHF
jgi:hypothetical protein